MFESHPRPLLYKESCPVFPLLCFNLFFYTCFLCTLLAICCITFGITEQYQFVKESFGVERIWCLVTGFNVEAVNWMLVFPTVLNSPGIYSEALMNM